MHIGVRMRMRLYSLNALCMLCVCIYVCACAFALCGVLASCMLYLHGSQWQTITCGGHDATSAARFVFNKLLAAWHTTAATSMVRVQ
jgi:hypothetical protein